MVILILILNDTIGETTEEKDVLPSCDDERIETSGRQMSLTSVRQDVKNLRIGTNMRDGNHYLASRWKFQVKLWNCRENYDFVHQNIFEILQPIEYVGKQCFKTAKFFRSGPL